MEIVFLISTQTLRLSSKKTIKSIVGGQERLDVLSRCFLNLHRWKNRLNANLSLIIFLSHPEEKVALTMPFTEIGNSVENEKDSTKLLMNILSEIQESEEVEIIEFETLLNSLSETYQFYYLTPNGIPIEEIESKADGRSMCFIIGSQHDLMQNQEETLSNYSTVPVSLGKQDYLASHVITIVCYKLSSLIGSLHDN